MKLPPALAKPFTDDAGNVLGQVVLDLTFYLPSTSTTQLDHLIEWYKRICPPNHFIHYATPETQDWDEIYDPDLTKSGEAAALAGEPMPFLAPVRKRIQAGRPFHVLFWDGLDLDTYCFALRQIRDDERNLHAFVRVTVPPSVDASVLVAAARDLAERIEFISGHGGLCFGYQPDEKFDAFTKIYPLARRYWGIDVEDLNETLPLMKEAIKPPNWLTLVGAQYEQEEAVTNATQLLPQTQPLIRVVKAAHGTLFQVGDAPIIGDRHRPSADLNALMALGTVLAPIVVQDHPSFSGDGFIDNDNTNGWVHRFDDPSSWS